MDKKTIQQWLDDSFDKGFIDENKYNQYYKDLAKAKDPSSFWKSIRDDVTGFEGALSIDKQFNPNRDVATEVGKEIPNIDYERLTPSNKRDIAKALNISLEDVDKAIAELDRRDFMSRIDANDREQKNLGIQKAKERADAVKDSKIVNLLGNEYAVRRYLEGAGMGEIAANQIAGNVGTLADFVPTTTKLGPVPVGVIAGATNPTIRATQRYLYEPSEDWDWGDEAFRLGKDIAINEATGLVKDQRVRKLIGDLAAGYLGMGGAIGKGVGDVIETAFEKYPKATGILGTGLMRKTLGGKDEPRTKQMIKDASKDYDQAVKETKNFYKNFWKEGKMLPMTTDSEITKQAYEEWKEENKENF